MASPALPRHTYEAYLALEAEAGEKMEYHDGYVTAMAGDTPDHSQIGINCGRALGNALERAGRDCGVHGNNLKLHVEHSRRSFYADVAVVCGPAEYAEVNPNALTNPILIVEVLSDSTAALDRGEKLFHYRRMPALSQYVLISQTAAVVDSFYRSKEDLWEIETARGLDAELTLKSVDCTIALRDLYRRVAGLNA